MELNRSIERRLLDQRLTDLKEVFGAPPPMGWIRAVRGALGMTQFDLATRASLSASRVTQLERAEIDGSIRMAQLGRLASALNCELRYVILPRETLEKMVRRQASIKARQQLARRPLAWPEGDRTLLVEALSEEFQALVHDLVDRRGLWH